VVVSNLAVGTYQFGFTATDQKGGKSNEDFVVVTVNAAATAGQVGRVFISIGQSNFLDKALNSDADIEPLKLALPGLNAAHYNLQIFNPRTVTHQPVQNGVNDLSASDPLDCGGVPPGGGATYPPTRGIFAGAFAMRLKELFPDETFYFVKKSADGQSLKTMIGSGGWKADLYSRLAASKQLLVAQGKTPEYILITGFGEADFAAGNAFAPMIDQLLSELKAAGYNVTRTVVGGVKDSDGQDKSSYRNQEIAWVNANPATRGFAFSSNWQGIKNDDIHVDGVTQAQKGNSDYPNAIFGVTGGWRIPQAATVPITTKPKFLSFIPTEGPIGTEVAIGGENFSNDMRVFFRGAEAVVKSRNGTTGVIAIVPSNAASGLISLLNGAATNDPATVIFTVTPGSSTPPAGGSTDKQPQFAGYLPIDKGEVGSSVTASGADFSSTMKAYVISYPGGVVTEATVTSRTGTDTVVFTIPAVTPGKYIFRLTNGTLSMDSNPANAFTITESTNSYASFYPTNAPAGSQQLHIGKGFATPAAITYPNGGGPSSVISSADGEAVVVIPANAGTGKLKIQGTNTLLTSLADFISDANAKSITFFFAEAFPNLKRWQNGNTIGGPLGYPATVSTEGVILAPRTTDSNHVAITTTTSYDFLNRMFVVQITQMLSPLETVAAIIAVGGNHSLYIKQGNTLYATINANNFIKQIPYNAAAHAFLGIANVGGDTVFLTSANGILWVEQARAVGHALTTADFCIDAAAHTVEPNPGVLKVRMAALINY
jgi:hypothetical protein